MRNAIASPSATDLYVLEQHDNRYVARPFQALDALGADPRLFSSAEIDDLIGGGASVTYQIVPPAVKVDGIPTWLAAVLGIAGAVGAAYVAGRRR